MKVVVDTNMVSPHTAPLALALAKLCGGGEIAYVVHEAAQEPFRTSAVYPLVKDIIYDATADDGGANKDIQEADVVMENRRNFELMERRVLDNRPTFYVSERWFKPIDILHLFDMEHAGGKSLWVSGFLRMLLPFGWRRAKRILKLLSQGENFFYLAIGIHAARDMARLCGLLHGDLRCLIRSPELDYERRPGGKVWLKNKGDDKKYCLDKMRIWGYFVAPSEHGMLQVRKMSDPPSECRILWVGRLVSWKRVDTIVRAVGEHADIKHADGQLAVITLDVYGSGKDESRLRRVAARYGALVKFHPSVPLADIRKLMHEYDILVLSSNEFEGWGAVVNEALEEGMKVIGTYEAGSSATILPEENLYHAGDWKRLQSLIERGVADVRIGKWTAAYAAQAVLDLSKGRNGTNVCC